MTLPALIESTTDVWGTNPLSEIRSPQSGLETLPSALDAPACLVRTSDRSQHFCNLLTAEIDHLEERLQELKMEATRLA